MPNNGNKQLFGPDGRPIIDVVGLVVLKIPIGSPRPSPQLLAALSQVTHCNVFVVPSQYDILTGRLAHEDIGALHHSIHQLEKDLQRQQTQGSSN